MMLSEAVAVYTDWSGVATVTRSKAGNRKCAAGTSVAKTAQPIERLPGTASTVVLIAPRCPKRP
ncbi:MAG: hypothetical protein QOF01_20 [Thermomicrobiales bacterium]|jgi:hypothetical protein|nr:hypothetical protein [Thermomicrobiales bacterium]